MNETRVEVPDDAAPTIEVRVYRDGGLVTTELCETRDDAAEVVASWEETHGVECEVSDLSAPVQDDFEVQRSADDERDVAVDDPSDD